MGQLDVLAWQRTPAPMGEVRSRPLVAIAGLTRERLERVLRRPRAGSERLVEDAGVTEAQSARRLK